MAQFTYYTATKLFSNILPNIKDLNHDIQDFQGAVLEVPIMLNPSLYRNLPSLKIRIKKNRHAKNLIVS